MKELEKASREFQEKEFSFFNGKGMAGYLHRTFIEGAEWQKQEFYNPPKSKQHLKTIERNYCDDCVHFRPDEEGERKPVDELCEFVRPLEFKMASTDDYFIFGNDWGFYLPGCKDYKRTE